MVFNVKMGIIPDSANDYTIFFMKSAEFETLAKDERLKTGVEGLAVSHPYKYQAEWHNGHSKLDNLLDEDLLDQSLFMLANQIHERNKAMMMLLRPDGW